MPFSRRLLLTCALTGLAPLAHAEPDAAQLIAQSRERLRAGVSTEEEQVLVRVQRSGHDTEDKRLTRLTRYTSGGEQVLIRFKEPSADRGLALLIQREAGQSQMWLRMPSWPQGRRIAADRETRYFGGTDLTFEDSRQLLGEALADFSYQLLRADANGWLIEATPKPGVTSGYAKRRLQLTPALALSEVQYLGESGQVLKTQRHERIQLDASGRWRVDKVTVSNPAQGSTSVFEIEARKLGLPLTDRQFSPAALAE